MKQYRVLTINPGSTSTKMALFEGEEKLFSESLEHDSAEINQFATLADQKPYRLEKVMQVLEQHQIALESIDAFVGRGGGQETMVSGTYTINELAYAHARDCYRANHPALLGSQIAYDLAQTYGKPSYIVNPPCVDEFLDESRLSGMKEIHRISHTHALNQKEMAIRYAKSIGKKYSDLNLVVAHVGGGLSVTAHRKGRMIDSNDCLGSSGAFAPTRSGDVPALALIKMCYSGQYTEKEMYSKVTKTGGLVSYLGTSDVRDVHKMIEEGNEFAQVVLNAMFLQINKEIGAMAATLEGKVDAIILTGGVAHDGSFTDSVKQHCGFIAPVVIMPGEFEMEAMANGALRVLTGEEEAKVYTGEHVCKASWFVPEA